MLPADRDTAGSLIRRAGVAHCSTCALDGESRDPRRGGRAVGGASLIAERRRCASGARLMHASVLRLILSRCERRAKLDEPLARTSPWVVSSGELARSGWLSAPCRFDSAAAQFDRAPSRQESDAPFGSLYVRVFCNFMPPARIEKRAVDISGPTFWASLLFAEPDAADQIIPSASGPIVCVRASRVRREGGGLLQRTLLARTIRPSRMVSSIPSPSKASPGSCASASAKSRRLVRRHAPPLSGTARLE
mmetsp:Transcript_30691/g.79726  ORF Transcript_30691/g.79726 Transcript_30691/m.79726 type:complete len:249 (-) Transcript_30691:826-1572(-)